MSKLGNMIELEKRLGCVIDDIRDIEGIGLESVWSRVCIAKGVEDLDESDPIVKKLRDFHDAIVEARQKAQDIYHDVVECNI